MVLAFLAILLFDAMLAVLVWLAWQRVTTHLKNNPEAARLIAEHVIAPLLTGEKQPKLDILEEVPEPEPKKTTLV